MGFTLNDRPAIARFVPSEVVLVEPY